MDSLMNINLYTFSQEMSHEKSALLRVYTLNDEIMSGIVHLYLVYGFKLN